jgi:purine-binding chemotaxis protein CheW
MSDRALIVRAAAWRCALPLPAIDEVMRPLPLAPLAAAPAFVAGVATIRGAPTPVVDLACLLTGATARDPLAERPNGRFVSLRSNGRRLALLVDEVVGLQELVAGPTVPTILGRASEHVAALTTLDAELLAVLETAQVVESHGAAR